MFNSLYKYPSSYYWHTGSLFQKQIFGILYVFVYVFFVRPNLGITRASTSDYFANLLICHLFFFE